MRILTAHVVPGIDDGLAVAAVDEPSTGGAHHRYQIAGPRTTDGSPAFLADVVFQTGPRGSAGANGVTHEALLAILIDRLTAFQAGPYPCGANAVAVVHLEAALTALKDRTAERLARGVEGRLTA